MYQKITNCKLICFILFALIFLQTAVLAFRAGVPLTIGYTAEHIALSAVTAQASGINAVLYNPAAVIAEEHERNFLSAYNKLPEDVNSYLLVYSNEFKNFNINQQARLSLFLAGLDAGKINQTLIDGRDYILTNNTKKYSALQFGLSSSFKNKNFLYGFNLKNYSENIADYKSSTFLFDAGILIKNFFIYFFDVGVSALNLGGSLKFTNESEKISDVYSVG
ncbi:MAG TPA: hypothetical protein PLM75_07820, partial [bacterium]|nr:hypothetical protein [bacterium]